VASFAGYQPRGTVEGRLTVTLAEPKSNQEPQLTFGHMLNVRAGWLDEHTFGVVYDRLEPRHAQSPVYPNGQANSRVEIVGCNARYLDCLPLLQRLSPNRTVVIKQFPEGDWPRFG
jgi:hypothetical protein